MPGHLGGMTWSGYAFDPASKLLVVNVNNLPARVRLIPRDKVKDDDGGWRAWAAGRGRPTQWLRRFLQSPSDLPCNPPPWGTLVGVDLAKGTIRWRVPLGSMQNFGGAARRDSRWLDQPGRADRHSFGSGVYRGHD